MLTKIRERLAQLHTMAPGAIGDQLGLELLEGDMEKREFLLRGKTEIWMRNLHGTLHGGMCATLADQAMGSIAFCFMPGEGILPTIDLHLDYLRPLIPGEGVCIRVRVVSVTKSLIHLAAELYREKEPAKLCITAGATYFYKPMAR